MVLTQTVKIQLQPNAEQIIKLRALQHRYTDASNYVSQYIFDHGFMLSQHKLHDALYYDMRERFGLPSQIAQSVIRSVIARYKTVKTQLKQKPYKYKDIYTNRWHVTPKSLEWLKQPIRFKSPVATLVRNRNYSKLSTGEFSVGTLDGREKMTYIEPKGDYLSKYDDWTFGEAQLVMCRGKWYLHIAVSRDPVDVFDLSQVRHVVGIDRGLRQLMTTFDESDQTQFYSGQEVLRIRRKYKAIRQELQSKNTKSSKRRLAKIERRENRWMTDLNHQLTKALVDQYGTNTLYIIEDLVNVTFDTVENRRKEARYEHVSWAFFELEQQLIYKAEASGSQVVSVAAQYTSQRCPKCGSIDKSNRNHQTHTYTCKNCTYRSNDDRVAAMNIQQLGQQYVSGVDAPRYTKLSLNTET